MQKWHNPVELLSQVQPDSNRVDGFLIIKRIKVVICNDGTSTWNRESKILELFLVSESTNSDRISDFEYDSLEFVCFQIPSKNLLEYFFC